MQEANRQVDVWDFLLGIIGTAIYVRFKGQG